MLYSAVEIRAWSSGWILALLLFLGAGAWTLSDLFDPPLPETPQLLRDLRTIARAPEKARPVFSLADLSVAQKEKIAAALSLPPPPPRKTEVAQVVAEEPARDLPVVREVPVVRLPVLTGVMVSQSIDGISSRTAFMDAGAVHEQQEIDGFRVASITPAGVVLVRDEKNWFVPMPEVRHTLNQAPPAVGGSAEADEKEDAPPASPENLETTISPPIPALKKVLAIQSGKKVS